MTAFGDQLPTLDKFTAANIKALAEALAQERGTGLGQLMNPLRLCLVGGSFGPDLALICEMLGSREVVARIKRALGHLKDQGIITIN